MAETVTTLAGDTVDQVLWRHRGATAALTEQTFELNRGLADLGPVLPAGVPILLPAIAARSGAGAVPVRDTVKLWD